MKSHVNSASIEIWRIIEVGFKVVDLSNLTRREVVDTSSKMPIAGEPKYAIAGEHVVLQRYLRQW